MNKTLYLKDEEGPIWDKARELSGDKLSPVVVEALRQFVAQKEAEANAMDRIVVEFDDLGRDNRPCAKAFYGRWLVPPEEAPSSSGATFNYAVAITAKEAAVIFYWLNSTDGTKPGVLTVYPSLEAALEATWGTYVRSGVKTAIHEAIRRRGVPVEELNV